MGRGPQTIGATALKEEPFSGRRHGRQALTALFDTSGGGPGD